MCVMGGVASSLLSRDMDDISSLVVRVRTEPKALWPTMEKLGQDATTRDELRAAVLAICHSDWNQFQILWSLGTLPIPKPPSLHPRVVHRLLSLRTTKAMLDTKEFWILLMKKEFWDKCGCALRNPLEHPEHLAEIQTELRIVSAASHSNRDMRAVLKGWFSDGKRIIDFMESEHGKKATSNLDPLLRGRILFVAAMLQLEPVQQMILRLEDNQLVDHALLQ